MNAGDYLEDEYEAAGLGIRLLKLADQQQEFSEATFGGIHIRGPKASLEHLIKEAWEKPDDIEEHADILLLLFDSRWRNGWTLRDLLNAAETKLAKNKARQWDTEWLFAEPQETHSNSVPPWLCAGAKGGKFQVIGWGDTPDAAFAQADWKALAHDRNHGVQHIKQPTAHRQLVFDVMVSGQSRGNHGARIREDG